jgi:glycine betaine/choline ABC-type transport system substrate-binding protein
MARRQSRRSVLRACGTGIVIATGTAGCVGNGDEGSDSDGDDTGETENSDISEIIVGSKNFTENIILGYMIFEIIENNTDVLPIDEMNYGNNAETFEGFRNREIHTYWDYTGTMWMADPPTHDEAISDPQEQYEAVKEQMESEYDLRVLDRTDFENTWVFFALPDELEGTGVDTLSDLAAYVNDGNYEIQLAVEDDFFERPDGWPELTDHYGFGEEALEEWESQGGVVVTDVGLAYDEVQYRDADVGLGYSTDAQLAQSEYERIEDDNDFWPPYNLVPVIAEEKTSETIVAEINKIPPAIGDAGMMQSLNARVNIDGESERQVARSFLESEGVI